jgi:maltooligosyltrehalose trehalohydrolase
MPAAAYPWEQPLGAHPDGAGGVTFRAWAPRAERVAVRLRGEDHPLADEGFGVHAATLDAAHGDRYELVLDGTAWPDPASRWQPDGLRGPSAVVDPGTFRWTDATWPGLALADAVIYELHVGTFSAAGTFDGAIEHLPALAELGITAIELMPVAEFPGTRGWGYDGVYLSAAQSSYGGPEGLHRLVDAAHGLGLAVLLDVVYNHVGASGGRALEAFGPYFTDKHATFWGAAINYDDAGADPVREWVLQSAEGWIGDFHLDGLRLDAIHAIYDDSARPIVGEVARRVHAADARALVIAESGLNDPRVVRPPDRGGLGCDAVWADDFHHALHALVTGERDGYYEEFGSVADFVKAYDRPHVHDGDYSTFRGRRFGAPADDVPPERFVVFDADHDQVGNRALGDRLAEPLRPLALFATLLSPFTPMLFMGEEYGENAPFQFFTDHIDEEIATATREGRRREFAAFAAFSGADVPDPQAEETFLASKLTRQADPALTRLTRDLLALRRELPRGDARAHGDEEARWVRVTRGPYELCMNFADRAATVPASGGELVFSLHGLADLGDDGVALPPLSAAVLRTGDAA